MATKKKDRNIQSSRSVAPTIVIEDQTLQDVPEVKPSEVIKEVVPEVPTWSPSDVDPQFFHPATIGYSVSSDGLVRWNPTKINLALAGKPWCKKTDNNSTDVPEKQFMPVQSTTLQSKFLEESVWPTLLPALEKLQIAIKYAIPRNVRDKYDDPSMKRIQHPEDAVGFNPVLWLANYLKRYNPNVPPKFTKDQAVIYLQTRIRAYIARKKVRQLKAQAAAIRAQQDHELARYRAAVTIQAFTRGRAVRQAIKLGRLDLIMLRD